MDEVSAKDSIKKKKKPECVLLSFFGDSSYNWIRYNKIVDFGEFYEEHSKQVNPTENFDLAVEEGKEVWDRRRGDIPVTLHLPNDFLDDEQNVQKEFNHEDNYDLIDLYEKYKPQFSGPQALDQLQDPSQVVIFLKQAARHPVTLKIAMRQSKYNACKRIAAQDLVAELDFQKKKKIQKQDGIKGGRKPQGVSSIQKSSRKSDKPLKIIKKSETVGAQKVSIKKPIQIQHKEQNQSITKKPGRPLGYRPSQIKAETPKTQIKKYQQSLETFNEKYFPELVRDFKYTPVIAQDLARCVGQIAGLRDGEQKLAENQVKKEEKPQEEMTEQEREAEMNKIYYEEQFKIKELLGPQQVALLRFREVGFERSCLQRFGQEGRLLLNAQKRNADIRKEKLIKNQDLAKGKIKRESQGQSTSNKNLLKQKQLKFNGADYKLKQDQKLVDMVEVDYIGLIPQSQEDFEQVLGKLWADDNQKFQSMVLYGEQQVEGLRVLQEVAQLKGSLIVQQKRKWQYIARNLFGDTSAWEVIREYFVTWLQKYEDELVKIAPKMHTQLKQYVKRKPKQISNGMMSIDNTPTKKIKSEPQQLIVKKSIERDDKGHNKKSAQSQLNKMYKDNYIREFEEPDEGNVRVISKQQISGKNAINNKGISVQGTPDKKQSQAKTGQIYGNITVLDNNDTSGNPKGIKNSLEYAPEDQQALQNDQALQDDQQLAEASDDPNRYLRIYGTAKPFKIIVYFNANQSLPQKIIVKRFLDFKVKIDIEISDIKINPEKNSVTVMFPNQSTLQLAKPIMEKQLQSFLHKKEPLSFVVIDKELDRQNNKLGHNNVRQRNHGHQQYRQQDNKKQPIYNRNALSFEPGKLSTVELGKPSDQRPAIKLNNQEKQPIRQNIPRAVGGRFGYNRINQGTANPNTKSNNYNQRTFNDRFNRQSDTRKGALYNEPKQQYNLQYKQDYSQVQDHNDTDMAPQDPRLKRFQAQKQQSTQSNQNLKYELSQLGEKQPSIQKQSNNGTLNQQGQRTIPPHLTNQQNQQGNVRPQYTQQQIPQHGSQNQNVIQQQNQYQQPLQQQYTQQPQSQQQTQVPQQYQQQQQFYPQQQGQQAQVQPQQKQNTDQEKLIQVIKMLQQNQQAGQQQPNITQLLSQSGININQLNQISLPQGQQQSIQQAVNQEISYSHQQQQNLTVNKPQQQQQQQFHQHVQPQLQQQPQQYQQQRQQQYQQQPQYQQYGNQNQVQVDNSQVDEDELEAQKMFELLQGA